LEEVRPAKLAALPAKAGVARLEGLSRADCEEPAYREGQAAKQAHLAFASNPAAADTGSAEAEEEINEGYHGDGHMEAAQLLAQGDSGAAAADRERARSVGQVLRSLMLSV